MKSHCASEITDGVEAQGELLVDAAVGVDQDVARVAVDPGERRELDRDPGLLGDLPDDRLPGRLADLDPAAGKLPVAVVDATDQQDLTSGVADRGERGRQQVVRARRPRILVELVQPRHRWIVDHRRAAGNRVWIGPQAASSRPTNRVCC